MPPLESVCALARAELMASAEHEGYAVQREALAAALLAAGSRMVGMPSGAGLGDAGTRGRRAGQAGRE